MYCSADGTVSTDGTDNIDWYLTSLCCRVTTRYFGLGDTQMSMQSIWGARPSCSDQWENRLLKVDSVFKQHLIICIMHFDPILSHFWCYPTRSCKMAWFVPSCLIVALLSAKWANFLIQAHQNIQGAAPNLCVSRSVIRFSAKKICVCGCEEIKILMRLGPDAF